MDWRQVLNQKRMQVEVFADETWVGKKNYLGIGCVYVKSSEKARCIRDLLDCRCLHSQNKKWTWSFSDCPTKGICSIAKHAQDDAIIHFNDIRASRSRDKFKVAKRWLNYFRSSRSPLFFKLIILDLQKLSLEKFGDDTVWGNIYNRFFRSNLIYGLKAFFHANQRPVDLQRVYQHHGAMQESHPYFPIYNLHKLDDLEIHGLIVRDYSVNFIDQDHRAIPDIEAKGNSQLIQFTDLLIGASCQVIFNTSMDTAKLQVAQEIKPLVVNQSKYPRLHISIFPENPICISHNITGDLVEEIHHAGQFTSHFKIKMPEYSTKVLGQLKK